MMARRWALRASRGSPSQMRTPGTVVAMGFNRLRAVSGASGLGSNVSCWGGPPSMYSTMQDRARARTGPVVREAPRASASWVRVKPRSELPPACKNVRRWMGVVALRGSAAMQGSGQEVQYPTQNGQYTLRESTLQSALILSRLPNSACSRSKPAHDKALEETRKWGGPAGFGL